jgi:hypothetical protein
MTVFISYRRGDSADVSGRIYDRLVAQFGDEAIFKDVDDIPIGVDFKKHLGDTIAACSVMLVVIGPRWLSATDERGSRRLDDPNDFVRIEIETALERDVPVVPLLVSGASMPKAEELPPSLVSLAYRNGMPIRPDPDFHSDVDRLIRGLEDYVTPQKPRSPARRPTPTPHKRAPGSGSRGLRYNLFLNWWPLGLVFVSVAIIYLIVGPHPIMLLVAGLILLLSSVYQDMRGGWQVSWLTYALAIFILGTGVAGTVNSLLGGIASLSVWVVILVLLGIVIGVKVFWRPRI